MKKILSVIVFSSLLLMSCKKEKTIVTPQTQTGFKKLKEMTVYYNGALEGNETYTYDAAGRILSVVYLKNIHLFEYPSNNEMKVTAKSNATGELIWTKTAKLNSKGAITEMEKRNPAGILAEVWNYSYDEKGYMVSYKYTTPLYNNDVREYFFVFENGNVVASKSYLNSVHQRNYTYEYNLNELSNIPSTPDFYWTSETLYGTPNKNPRKAFKSTKASDGTVMFQNAYTRIYNSGGSSFEEKIQYLLTGASGNIKYTF